MLDRKDVIFRVKRMVIVREVSTFHTDSKFSLFCLLEKYIAPETQAKFDKKKMKNKKTKKYKKKHFFITLFFLFSFFLSFLLFVY